MQLTVTIESSFVDPTTRRRENREHTLALSLPAHLYWPFKVALNHFVREGKLGTAKGLKVTIPHRMSWDPVLKVRNWADTWLQQSRVD